MNYKDEQPNGANGLDWQFPIPKHHKYAICIFLTLSLLTAILLPSPEDLPENSGKNQWSTGRFPDNHLYQQDIIYAPDDNATESIDSESIPEQDLTDPDDEDLSTDNQSSDDSSSLENVDADWYVQTVRSGDNAVSIFHTINIPYEALKAIESIPNDGKYITSLTPDEKMYFLISEKSKLLELVKPISKTEQIHYTIENPAGDYKFIAKHEPINSHLSADDESHPASELETAEQKKKEEQARRARIEENNRAVALAKAKADERLKKEAELRKKHEEERKLLMQRKALTVITVQKGETLSGAISRAGLTKNERHVILKTLEGRYSAKKVQPGDELRVLFESNKPNSRINAVSYSNRSAGRITLYRNPANNKYYTDATVKKTTTGSSFRRYPVAGPIRITSNFNPYRRHPVTGKVRPHNGTDFGVKVGTPIFAPADGVVVRATYQYAAGNYIVIQHQNGYSTVYMHLSRILVRVGDRIKSNQRIALSGNTGYSTGPHLHYELRINNRPVNAMKVNLPSFRSSATGYDNKFKKQIAIYKRQLQIK